VAEQNQFEIMKENKIYMQEWLDFHQRVKVVDTDRWYLGFANRLAEMLAGLSLYREVDTYSRQETALLLTLYLEDCVADDGNWRQFIRWHHREYGRYLPFYTLTDNYFPDEINLEDIAFILWNFYSDIETDEIGNPLDDSLLKLAGVIYKLMDEIFEEAPISSHLAPEWLIGRDFMEIKRTPLPVPVPGGELPESAARFLEASGGKPLMFFDSHREWAAFAVEKMGWRDHDFIDSYKECRNFIMYGNPKGVLMALDIAECLAHEDNPCYDQKLAVVNAYRLFCEQGLCPFDLLKYAMEYRLLPDAQFPFEDGKRLLHENWDFVARWFLDEYYEGD